MQPTGSAFLALFLFTPLFLTVGQVSATANLTTLYYVQPNTPTPTLPPRFSIETSGTTVVSPAGSGVYVGEILNSLIVVHGPSTTLTLLSTLRKEVFTLSEDVSSLHINVRPTIGQHDNDGPLDCALDRSASTGKCVGVVEGVSIRLASNGQITVGPSYTQTTTFSGNLLPIATVAVSSASSLVAMAADRLCTFTKAAGLFYVFILIMGMLL